MTAYEGTQGWKTTTLGQEYRRKGEKMGHLIIFLVSDQSEPGSLHLIIFLVSLHQAWNWSFLHLFAWILFCCHRPSSFKLWRVYGSPSCGTEVWPQQLSSHRDDTRGCTESPLEWTVICCAHVVTDRQPVPYQLLAGSILPLHLQS